MTETVTIDRQSAAKPVSRPRSRKPATVQRISISSAPRCSRTYIGKLEAEGVIERRAALPLRPSNLVERLAVRMPPMTERARVVAKLAFKAHPHA